MRGESLLGTGNILQLEWPDFFHLALQQPAFSLVEWLENPVDELTRRPGQGKQYQLGFSGLNQDCQGGVIEQ